MRLGFLHILQPKPEAATVKGGCRRTQLSSAKTGIKEMCTGGTFESEEAGRRVSFQATESGQVVCSEPVGPAGWTAEGEGRSRSRGAWGRQRGSLPRGPESLQTSMRGGPATGQLGTGTQTTTGIQEGDRHPARVPRKVRGRRMTPTRAGPMPRVSAKLRLAAPRSP